MLNRELEPQASSNWGSVLMLYYTTARPSSFEYEVPGVICMQAGIVSIEPLADLKGCRVIRPGRLASKRTIGGNATLEIPLMPYCPNLM
jgi:hypothetical protein